MKSVLFFIESLSRGGAEKVLSDIVSNLNKEKYDVTVCTVTDEGDYQPKVEQSCNYQSFLKQSDLSKSFVHRFIYRLKLKLIYFLPSRLVYKWCFKEKYDVEIAFIEGFATKLIATSSDPKSKKIAWVHTDVIKNPYADKYYSSLKKHCDTYRKFNEILCVSEYVKSEFEQKFFYSNYIHVQYNVIDTSAIISLSLEDDSTLKNKSIISLFSMGRLEEAKGYIRLVKIMGVLHAKGYTFELMIFGEGSQRQQIESIITQCQMNDCVHLLGFHSNPYKLISKCDAFICSSYAEGFSTAATEALILGKPIFTTDCSGMKELFGEESCGEIVDNTDEALYNLLERIVSGDIDLSQYRIGINRRKEFFGIKKRIKEIEDILDE